jgi:hypothetical protein
MFLRCLASKGQKLILAKLLGLPKTKLLNKQSVVK